MPTPTPMLLAVPNVSEGRDLATVAAIGAAFSRPQGVRLLDTHSDADHHRSVFTLAGPPGALADGLLEGAEAAQARIEVIGSGSSARAGSELGQHPHVGAVDVVPIVYLEEAMRGAACAEALVVADRVGQELATPVFLYGALAGGRTRAELRRGGVERLAQRMRAGELQPDFGPRGPHPSAGATLVTAREPLVAFNLQLAAPASVGDAGEIASLIREGGKEGLQGVRAIAVQLSSGRAQVSMNVERPLQVPLVSVLEAVGRHAEVASAELVGLAPQAAFEGFPPELLPVNFNPARHLLEQALLQ